MSENKKTLEELIEKTVRDVLELSGDAELRLQAATVAQKLLDFRHYKKQQVDLNNFLGGGGMLPMFRKDDSIN